MKLRKLIKETAQQSILTELQTIAGLKSSIDDDFCAIIEMIYQSKGRVVLTGVGKSAIVAQKIVATLNSTGTPATFMHAADAIHGDLGMIQAEDTIICISKSGNTAEIKVLIPFLKNLNKHIVGIVSQQDSFLAKEAHYCIYVPVSMEADPNNLAPTSSTTAQMVIGDAIAMALLALRGFSASDFAQFHPGGMLGKQLYLRVANLYAQNERPFVYENDSIPATIIEMTAKRLGCAVVLNQQQEILGLITDGDLRRMLNQHTRFLDFTAKDIMTRHPKTVEKDTLAVKALQLMRAYSITQLIVVENNQYLGIVHLHDLIREGIV